MNVKRMSHPEQVRQFYEEAVTRSIEGTEAKRLGLGERASISGEEHGAGIRLIREEPISPKGIPRRCRRGRQCPIGLKKKDRGEGPRLVTKRVLLRGIVLPDEADEDGTGKLVFDFEPRDSPDLHR